MTRTFRYINIPVRIMVLCSFETRDEMDIEA